MIDQWFSLEDSTQQQNYTLFATQSNMADYNNVLSTIIRETADQHLPPLKKKTKQRKQKANKSSTKLYGRPLTNISPLWKTKQNKENKKLTSLQQNSTECS